MANDLEKALSWLEDEDTQKEKRAKMPVEPRKQRGTMFYTSENTNAPQSEIEALNKLQRKIDKKQDEKAEISAIFKQYQESTRVTGKLRTDILKGITAGENIYKLFLLAAKAIALATNDHGYYGMVEKSLLAVHGEGLGERGAIEIELSQAQERLKKLMAAESQAESEDAAKRIKRAIEDHKAHIKKLEESLTA